MNYKINSSNCSIIDDSSETSVIAKLRRLKIEENLLVNNINKIIPKESYEQDIVLPVIYSLEYKNYAAKLRNSFSEIKYMFSDIKVVTEDNLSSIDIENMKRDVIKLDEKIRNFKNHVQFELTSLTCQEEELTTQKNTEDKELKSMLKSKTRIKAFNQIVPSPVKVLIQSPFKCQEVQQFQEFMKSSPNRYGGWAEYHHNVFVQIWHKHFHFIEQMEFNNESELIVGNQDQKESFLKEILQKIPGSTYGDVVLHQNWYSKYLYLKKQQQNALDKWKMNKRRSTGTQNKPNKLDEHSWDLDNQKKICSNGAKLHTNMKNLKDLFDTETRNAEEIANALCDMTLHKHGLSSNTEIDVITRNDRKYETTMKQKQRSFSDLIKPTRQWTNRCNSSNECVKGYNDLETIQKLRVPEWRLTLQD